MKVGSSSSVNVDDFFSLPSVNVGSSPSVNIGAMIFLFSLTSVKVGSSPSANVGDC